METSQKPGRSTKRLLLIIGAILLGLFILGLTVGEQEIDQPSSTTNMSSSNPSPLPSYESVRTSIISSEAIDPATRRIRYLINNRNPYGVKLRCTVRSHNASKTYNGFDFVNVEVASKVSKAFETDIIVTNEGAAYADQTEVECDFEGASTPLVESGAANTSQLDSLGVIRATFNCFKFGSDEDEYHAENCRHDEVNPFTLWVIKDTSGFDSEEDGPCGYDSDSSEIVHLVQKDIPILELDWCILTPRDPQIEHLRQIARHLVDADSRLELELIQYPDAIKVD